MAGKVIGRQPSPRTLIIGFDEDTRKRIGALVGYWQSVAGLSGLQMGEWDLIVTSETLNVPNHLDLIRFEAGRAGASAGLSRNIAIGASTFAREFVVEPGLHPDLEQLVERVLLPAVQSRSENPVMIGLYTGGDVGEAIRRPEPWLMPFLYAASDNTVLAGSFLRPTEGPEAWLFPPGIPDPVPWVRAAIRTWHKERPDRYPNDPGWPSDETWMTAAELDVRRQLSELEAARTAFNEESDNRESGLRGTLAAASDDGEAGPRRLLTAKGDALVGAVEVVLHTLGFEVENRDLVNTGGGGLREDLRVTSPDDTNWIALVEVKGRSGGAATNDLLQLGRWVEIFIEVERRRPARRWYLINQFIDGDPASRPAVFADAPDVLANFIGLGGMAMDTADLFRLARDVEVGKVPQAEAREKMMSAVGRLTYP